MSSAPDPIVRDIGAVSDAEVRRLLASKKDLIPPPPPGYREFNVWTDDCGDETSFTIDAKDEKDAAEIWAEEEAEDNEIHYDDDEGPTIYVKNPEGVISRWNTTVRVKVVYEAKVDEHYGKDHTCAHCGLVGDCYYNQPLKKFYCREGCEAAKGRGKRP